jgi:hypothetical protein
LVEFQENSSSRKGGGHISPRPRKRASRRKVVAIDRSRFAAGWRLLEPDELVEIPGPASIKVDLIRAADLVSLQVEAVNCELVAGGSKGPALRPIKNTRARLAARLRRRDPAIPTDLGWKTVATAELAVRGKGARDFEVAWVGELDAGKPITLTRPGGNPNWRVTVEEWEKLPGDFASPAEGAPPIALVIFPVWERRLIYADEVLL